MVVAVALDDVKSTYQRFDKRGYSKITYIGARDDQSLPLATLNEQDPGRVSSTHFHIVDQFQVVLDGGGTIGRHKLAPYGVHFTRAYTPYGPLVADKEKGLKFFVMRAHPDTGSQRLPKEQEQLNRAPNRDPWQVTSLATFPTAAAASGATMEPIPGVTDDRGLAGYSLSMKPNARVQGPDPANGDGQFLVVTKGGVLHEGKEHNAPALLWVWPKDGPLPIQAGAQGVEAIILNFPRPRTSIERAAPSVKADAGFKKWQCQLCSFSYDEALGMPDEGIAAGTRWQDVPDSWTCPDCSTSKTDFQMVEV